MAANNWRQALTAAKRLALRFPGVIGVDYGYKYLAGVRTTQQCVRFHVARKLAPSALRPHETLPKELGFVACDVLQASYAPQASPPHFGPMQPGAGIGNVARASAGTVGAFVREADGGRLCLLSSWHVLCASTAAQIGEAIAQPGPLAPSSAPQNPVAQLQRWLDPARGYDAAIARLARATAGDASIGRALVRCVEEPALGILLTKIGAASGTTHALVDGIEGMYELDYSDYGDRKRWMEAIRLIPYPGSAHGAISMAGDSGAVWVNPETECAAALHFAGKRGVESASESALAHPIPKILGLLNLTPLAVC